ncbi:MAG: hypothetical protein HY549_11215 [Elusimicrobia bacterium]|nr:hypothetical protein [Elusimicrobiota bacterium]
MPNKVLLIRLSSLGDVVLTAPVLRAIKAHWPDCRVSLLVKPDFAEALQGHPCLDEIIPFEGLSPALARIREGGFTHVLDLHGNLRSFLLRRLCGIPVQAVYRKHALARRLFVAFGFRSPSLEMHTVERYLDAPRSWGIPPAAPRLSLEDVRGGSKLLSAGTGHVLLIQTAFLGDTLLTLPLARGLKAQGARRLSVLTLESHAELFRGSEWVDEVIIDRKRGEHGGLRGLLRLSRRLRSEAFDLAVIPHRSFRSALLAYLAAIPRRVGFASSAGRWFLTDALPFSWLMHDLERNLSLLGPLDGRRLAELGDPVYLPAEPARAEELRLKLRAEAGADHRGWVGVHPGAAWTTKRWLPERYRELCRGLAAAGYGVVLIGSSKDSEVCAAIAAGSGALDWSGRTDLSQLRALMGCLSLFVTNDSGPMHVATASGVPTLALFGPTSRELGFFPYGREHRVLEQGLDCRPCGLHGGARCPEGHFLCMRLITTDQALSAALEMLARAQPASPAAAGSFS